MVGLCGGAVWWGAWGNCMVGLSGGAVSVAELCVGGELCGGGRTVWWGAVCVGSRAVFGELCGGAVLGSCVWGAVFGELCGRVVWGPVWGAV